MLEDDLLTLRISFAVKNEAFYGKFAATQFAVLTTTQISSLSSTQVKGLTTVEFAALTTLQMTGFTSTALTSSELTRTSALGASGSEADTCDNPLRGWLTKITAGSSLNHVYSHCQRSCKTDPLAIIKI